MKATPGPWYKAASLIYSKSGAVAIAAEPEAETTDEIRPVDIGSKRFSEAMANACLIAAAPDLLSVLKEALEESGCDGDLCCHWWHEAARAAIRKAEGHDL